jgi:pyruvate dehydrogenase E2 component (dihydrolipoamide acetyltransferase)
MPKLEMSQETGTVIEWLKQEGEAVEKGEPLLTIETDKVTVEVEAPSTGILAGVTAQPQQEIPVAQTIAYILAPGEEIPTQTEEARPSSQTITRDVSTEPPSSPIARRMAEEHGIDLRDVPGSGPGGKVNRADVAAFLADARAEGPAAQEQGRVRAAPAARRLARELTIDLRSVRGTGPQGRIQSADVRDAALGGSTAELSGPRVRRMIPLEGMRRTIADRMLRSVREAPQFTVEVDVDMGRALDVIEDHRSLVAESGDSRVTLTAFLVKACAWALVRHPAMNAAFRDKGIVEWADVNVGVAVAVDNGLIVPTIRGADSLELKEIAERLADLVARARAAELRPNDVTGGTFTLSNLGMFGIDRFTAILNPPQAGILAAGRVKKRPMVADDQLIVRPLATLSLTADHRVVDGAIASRFLASLQEAVEHPGVML